MEINTEMISNKRVKQLRTAIPLGIFLRSSQLQKGKNNVDKMPPMHNGIRNSFATYNPKIIRNNKAVFCKNEVGVVII